MNKYAILFAVILAACGPEPEPAQNNNDPTVIVVNNPIEPSCDWTNQVYSPDTGCVDIDPEETIVIECEEGEIPVSRNGVIDCEYIGACPEGYYVDIQDDTWSCIRPTDPVEPDCGAGYELFERDGVYYCRDSRTIICPDGYIPTSDGLTFVGCAQRADYDETADYDQDGYTAADGDCDDTRSDVHPDAQEICDGVDNDCNGTIDINYMGVDMRTTFYLDQDQDGFGDPNHFELRCSHGGLLSATNGLDCNDSRAGTHPGAEEICGDGVDQDCDGADLECLENDHLTYCIGTDDPKGIILPATNDIQMARVNLHGTLEQHSVKKLTLLNCLNSDQNGTCIWFGEDRIVKSVQLRYTDSWGNPVTKEGFFYNHQVTFSGLDIPTSNEATGDSGYVEIFISTPENVFVNLSGAQVGIMISSLSEQNHEFEAIGLESGRVLDEYSPEVSGCGFGLLPHCSGNGCRSLGTKTFRYTKPTISLAAGSPSGAGVPGMNEILRINVSADSRGYVVLKELGFKIVTADEDHDFNLCDTLADPSKFDFYDTADPNTLLDDDGDWLFVDDDGEEILDCDPGRRLAYAFWIAVGDSTVGPVEIPAGQTYTFALEIDTTGASSAEDDGLRVDIPTEAEVNALSASDADAVRWSDASYDRNIDGTYIHNLPIRGGFVQY